MQGAFQELKLYGSPTQAEVQCVNTFEVSNFNKFILLIAHLVFFLLLFFGYLINKELCLTHILLYKKSLSFNLFKVNSL